MSLHLFANVVTPFGTAANNRAETEGYITTLQKLIWKGEPHSTVSAEAIRFALRRLLADAEKSGTNRHWNEDARANEWKDHTFDGWNDEKGKTFIDDDLLGFMTAEAAKDEKGKGSANVRRAVLEITRAVSLTPWYGDVTFNAASPGATPSASKGEDRNKNPVPYGTEVHATRYQFGLALTPERLRDKSRAAKALEAVGSLRTVAGNHGRFLFDFSPEAIIIRITRDPAPRLLYCFNSDDSGATVTASALIKRIEVGDVLADELVVGVSDLDSELSQSLRDNGVSQVSGVRGAIQIACESLQQSLNV
ncbi:type I-B CRISPR-associated protein Cas7/Cst2/DevR [Rubinisphaera margarita]|uniref:type I-B CRISPR-associated protein Cas7/Cst2/DevR n=1 Tax=Rubinisphaera margarita TaxID=2909586 RepID=UPI001EE8EDD8|nr:type I-B CRISPR-associated protein Cas7/Cst2/DevR [Rubinisphaera margarita]MCG6157255.1 type I-B CRISPR-associated protein Cas7/Cst2/DevR [Rubinisphaera margarita]